MVSIGFNFWFKEKVIENAVNDIVQVTYSAQGVVRTTGYTEIDIN